MRRVAEKVAIVTGARGGLGSAICEQLLAEGAQVIGFDIAGPEGSGDDSGIDHRQVDVRSETEVAAAIEAVAKAYGQIDVLVNNAGVPGRRGPSHEASVGDFDDIFAINVRGPWLCTKYAVPHMIEAGAGSIVNMSSMYGLVGNTMVPLYHATKGALRLLTKADAATYAANGVRVNSVHPGSIETGSRASVRADTSQEALAYNARVLQRIPLGHRGVPVDIAHGVVYLASEESRYMTGAELVIDGGYTAV